MGGVQDVSGIVTIVQDSVSSGLNYVKWVEGINEPNSDFGWGKISASAARDAQVALWQQINALNAGIPVCGPSIVFSLPAPENSLNGFMGAYAADFRASSHMNNLHVYPPKSPNADDLSPYGGALGDIQHGYQVALPGKPALNTEFHPTLYSKIHKNDHAYDACWGPIHLLSAYLDFNWTACFWFALFDYYDADLDGNFDDNGANADDMICGLFRVNDTTDRPVARAFRALFQLTGDQGGAERLSFNPGRLNVSVSNLPPAPANSPRAGGRWALFQNSAGTYFLLLWNEQNNLSSTSVPVTVSFPSHSMALVEEFNVTSGNLNAVQVLSNVNSFTVNLDTSVRLIRIAY